MLDLFGIISIGKFFTYLTAFFGAFLAALWLSLIFWTLRDIRSRSHDKLVHILAAILVAVLNLPGIIIYLILRPRPDAQTPSPAESEGFLARLRSGQDTSPFLGITRTARLGDGIIFTIEAP